jgi:hypothetical protein
LTLTLCAQSALFCVTQHDAAAAARVRPRDRAATRAYLKAKYAYEQALVSTVPAVEAATDALAHRISGECPGVLSGAPAPHGLLGSLLEPPPPHQTPRQMGEANRITRQWTSLQLELAFALDLPRDEYERRPALAFAATVRTLRWSNNGVNAFEHAIASLFGHRPSGAVPSVCADLLGWAHSGYKALTPATKALTDEENAFERSLIATLGALASEFLSRDPLAPYQGPQERALAAKIASLEQQQASSRKRLAAAQSEVRQTLGLESQAEAEADERPAKGSTEIERGKTAAGGRFSVWIEPKRSRFGGPVKHCDANVNVYENHNTGVGVVELNSGSGQACLSRRHPVSPDVFCADEGILTIEAQTLPGTRRVRLVLSDGRRITSSVALVPASLGGPIGFYYQAVRGPTPIPVELTELDRRGRVLRSVRLPHTERCAKRKLRRTSRHKLILARGNLPQGGSFTIAGERITGEYQSPRSRLAVEVPPEEGFGIFGLVAAFEGAQRQPSRAFGRQLKTGCIPHEYAIVYGVLKHTSDAVLVRSAGTLQALHRARMPTSLHLGAVLAYIALPSVPSEVVVRTRSGKVVVKENLSRPAREARETCEGEAEP